MKGTLVKTWVLNKVLHLLHYFDQFIPECVNCRTLKVNMQSSLLRWTETLQTHRTYSQNTVVRVFGVLSETFTKNAMFCFCFFQLHFANFLTDKELNSLLTFFWHSIAIKPIKLKNVQQQSFHRHKSIWKSVIWASRRTNMLPISLIFVCFFFRPDEPNRLELPAYTSKNVSHWVFLIPHPVQADLCTWNSWKSMCQESILVCDDAM